ncbi:M23 family metallopeptidase [Algoriphagus sp. NG3]|uniref:M23 family metallopeptidase n=1 Tax=Algoriphagus sp. NG3 TaxID=3097546 RepID=UPI002A81B186|nr:M23 family metallopeptidase [Algoriphagus sp. NG3]WPR77377.1 M23 family metallopeptidase [Algoriphagus sp. NG3]
MIHFFTPLYLSLSLILGTATINAQEDPAVISMQVPFISSYIVKKEEPTVYYELHLTNHSKYPVQVDKVEVLNPKKKSAEFFTSDKEDLKSRFSEKGFTKENEAIFLMPESTGVVYLEYGIYTRSNLNIKHQITFSSQGKSYTNIGGKVKINFKKPVILGAPLKDGLWAAIHNPTWQRGHRRVFYTVDGETRIPGRFAIDFMKVDENGKTATGDKNMVVNWYGFNADVLAVSDGIISSVRNDFIDSEKLDRHPRYNSLKATGNYISLSIGNNNYVFYEHLKAGSIRVKPGQKVKKGEVIASLGFTGQATGPHLHFHVANKNSPLGAEGLPFVFENFTLLGMYDDFNSFGIKPWVDLELNYCPQQSNEYPPPNSVLLFD